ncbi:hypothetical protein Vretifemale_1365 [Volvox reticuliferus]|uniref:Uncharacterized protein n=1 Tax=Volvox reticuliferus TaxID=1737510 RepID=A0A8J4FH36_9CHLO|nr:hypothetical protein Vretifemale_1365 [Volvox reticuliferus]
MQSRKELAEAGRRKLEEFRKAKAQGKAVTSASVINPSEDPTPAPPATSNASLVPPPLVNGNGGSYPYGGPAQAPAQPQRGAVAATVPNIPSGPAGAALTSAQPFLQTLERPSIAPEVAPKPKPVPTTTIHPLSTTSTPITTFVVLEDAPIPFGGPAAAAASPGHQGSSNGVAHVNGDVWPPCGLSMAARSGGDTEARTQALSLLSGGLDIRPVSNGVPFRAVTESKSVTDTPHGHDGASGGHKIVDGLEGSVNSKLGNGVQFSGSPGKSQHMWPVETTKAPVSSSTTAAFPVAAAAAAPSPSPFGDRADAGSGPYPIMAGSSAAITHPTFPPAFANGLEARADPVTKGHLSARTHVGVEAIEPPLNSVELNSRASTQPTSMPLLKTNDVLPVQSASVDEAQTAAPPVANLASSLGYGGAPDMRPHTRPPWPAPKAASAASSAGPTSSTDIASAAPLRGSVPLASVVLQSGASSATSQEAASTSDTTLWSTGVPMPAEVEAVTAAAAAAAAGVVNSVTCYDQLSDNYLGTNNRTPASVAPDARASTTKGASALSERLGDAAPGKRLSETPSGPAAAAPVSASSSSADRGADSGITSLAGLASAVAADIAIEPPTTQPEFSSPSSSALRILEPQGLPPTRAAPAPSRFAWLFGSPPSAKQTVSLEQPVTAAAPTQTPVLPPAAHPTRSFALDQAFPAAEDRSLHSSSTRAGIDSRTSASASSTWTVPDAGPKHAPSFSTTTPIHSVQSPEGSYYPVGMPVDVEVHGAANGLSEGSRVQVDVATSSSASGLLGLLPGQTAASATHPETAMPGALGAGPGASIGVLLPLGATLAGPAAAGRHGDPGEDAYVPHQPVFSNAVYGAGITSVGVTGGAAERGVVGLPLPSFLQGIDTVTAVPGREDRTMPPTVVQVPPVDSSGPSNEMAAGADAAVAEGFMTAPSFSTSFPPLPSASPLPLPPTASRPPPAAPAPVSTVTTVSTPHFATTTSYLSAYSSAAGAIPHGGPLAATTVTTSSFLESYLDNLLSTMSTAPRDGVEDSNAQSQMHGRKGDTPRHSKLGDAPGDAGTTQLGPHATEVLSSEGPEVASGDNVSKDDQFLCTRDSGDAEAAPDASGSGRAGALPQIDGTAQLRGHHSRHVSTDSGGVLSAHTLATGVMHAVNAYGPGGSNSGVSRAQFAALQQHIDELTEEKLALARGLQQQTRINEQLAEENEALMRQYNARGSVVEELQRKVKQYEQELEAQTLSLEGFSEERHAARSSYAEASSRAQALAAEVVGLEAQVLQLKSAVLKAERTAEEAQQRAKKLGKQVETLTLEAQGRAQELHQTQLKGRNLVVKLKQTEARLEAAEGKLAMQIALAGTTAPHGSLVPNGHHPPLPPLPLPKPTAEQEVQCDLAAELDEAAQAAARSGASDGSGVNGPREDAAAATMSDGGQERVADGASISSSAAQDGADVAPLLLARQPSAAVSTEISDAPDRLVRVDWDAARPPRDAPSAVVAERALASMDSRELRAAARGALPEGLGAVALQLARWLPAGPVSGGDPVAVMVEEELRLIESIHELLGSFEQAQEATMDQIAELRGHVAGLTSENDELRQKLELQTQRLELQMQGLTTTIQPVSQHQTPAAGPSAHEEGATGVVAMTPSSPSRNYLPAQPFLPVSAEHEAAVITPTRSIHMTPLMDSPAAGAPPLKQTWMGYLFRPRQKKRTRTAIL